MEWLQPSLLAALPIAALPLLVHWLMRPRSRPIRFPALALVAGKLAAGQRARRLKSLVLLAVRSLLMALIVILLAGPQCRRAGALAPEAPTLIALVVDDSWSTRYAIEPGETTLDRLLERARRQITQWPRTAGPTRFALLWAAPGSEWIGPTEDRTVVLAALRATKIPPPHAVPLGGALARAAKLLRDAPEANRRLILVTDLAAHAFRDLASARLADIDNLSVDLLAPTDEARTNLAIAGVQAPRGPIPETLAAGLSIHLAAQGVDALCQVIVSERGREWVRSGPIQLAASQAQTIEVRLPPLLHGLHGLTVELAPGDRLGFDQTRYVALSTIPPPVAWLVTPPAGQPDADLAPRIVANLLAPADLPDDQQRVRLEWRTGPDLDGPTNGWNTPADPPAPALVVLLPGVRLAPAAAQRLGEMVERGATLLLLASGRAAPPDWPGLRQRISGAPPRVEAIEPPLSLTSASGIEDGNGWTQEVARELANTRVRRRIRFDRLSDDVQILARFADGVPAILAQARGQGVMLLLATSPEPEWSELGVRAAGMLSWLHALCERRAAVGPRAADFVAGSQPGPDWLGETTSESILLTREGNPAPDGFDTTPDPATIGLRLVGGRPAQGWPTARPGIYRLEVPVARSTVAQRTVAMYSINWPPEESDLRRTGADAIRHPFGIGTDRFAIVTDEAIQAPGGLPTRAWGLSPLQVVMLLALSGILVEALLGQRK